MDTSSIKRMIQQKLDVAVKERDELKVSAHPRGVAVGSAPRRRDARAPRMPHGSSV